MSEGEAQEQVDVTSSQAGSKERLLWPVFIYLEAEKVYLEAVYKKPKYLATVIFAANAILLGFTASGCIVRY